MLDSTYSFYSRMILNSYHLFNSFLSLSSYESYYPLKFIQCFLDPFQLILSFWKSLTGNLLYTDCGFCSVPLFLEPPPTQLHTQWQTPCPANNSNSAARGAIPRDTVGPGSCQMPCDHTTTMPKLSSGVAENTAPSHW